MVDQGFRVYGKSELVSSHEPLAVTIGNFDGVHLGHIHVIKTLRELAGNYPTLALTFDPHPSKVISPNGAKASLVSQTGRVDLLLKAGVDVVVVQNFTKDFSQLSADQFIDDYLIKNFKVKAVVIGFDFCYGAQRLGDWTHLQACSQRHGFVASRANPLIMDGTPVSSSRVRNAIVAKEFRMVERLLGRPFLLDGVVVKGDQRGRLIGFPTANLGAIEENCLIPPFGVYAVEIFLEGESSPRPGVMNCGVRPTIGAGLKLQIEAHILDFSADLYGKKIAFAVKKFIRTEMKFSGLDHLKSQIQSDVNEARIYFGV